MGDRLTVRSRARLALAVTGVATALWAVQLSAPAIGWADTHDADGSSSTSQGDESGAGSAGAKGDGASTRDATRTTSDRVGARSHLESDRGDASPSDQSAADKTERDTRRDTVTRAEAESGTADPSEPITESASPTTEPTESDELTSVTPVEFDESTGSPIDATDGLAVQPDTPSEETSPPSEPTSGDHARTTLTTPEPAGTASTTTTTTTRGVETATSSTPAAAAERTPEVTPTVAIETPSDTELATAEPPTPQHAANDIRAAVTAAAYAATPRAPEPASVLDLIGTAVFTLLNAALTLFQGLPAVPAGSTVTVSRSTLQLPCSSASCTVPADWYFPEGEPKGLIYFQHGILANSAMYSHTAANLAEQTGSIVVAPSIISNVFAPDALWLGGTPMAQAIADLFGGDRAALNASAAEAAGRAVELPDTVVLVGHSLGGGTVLAAAGDMARGDSIDDLGGVVLLDGVAVDSGLVPRAMAALPDDLPVLLVSSPPYWLNRLGGMATQLTQARPDRFNGVELAGGSHIDAMQGSNPIVQLGANLVGGIPKTANVAATRAVAAGWINDMLTGTDTGLTGVPGQQISIPTAAGTATGTALPAAPAPTSPVDVLITSVLDFAINAFFNIEPTSGFTGGPAPSLLNVVGSVVLNVVGGAVQVFSGPPILPPDTPVTVRSSTLTIPETGQTVPTDWYFPATVDSSTRLIYLQHGFMATGPMYSYTAAHLAEQTNSIVVAPTLSSNFLDANANWLDGTTMAHAIADVFSGDRAALTASASAAAGRPIALPTEFVMVGHSGGGTLVSAVAGELTDNGGIADLAGVVLLDAVDPAGSNQIAGALEKLVGVNDRPVLLISSEPYFWSRNGNAAAVLEAARPGRFNGVKLEGGLHIDYLQGGNPVIQFAEYLVAGFSLPQNIHAAQAIEVGWINDMFDGTSTGIRGTTGERIAIDTPAGTATAVVLPMAPSTPDPITAILSAGFDFIATNFFVYSPVHTPVSPAYAV